MHEKKSCTLITAKKIRLKDVITKHLNFANKTFLLIILIQPKMSDIYRIREYVFSSNMINLKWWHKYHKYKIILLGITTYNLKQSFSILIDWNLKQISKTCMYSTAIFKCTGFFERLIYKLKLFFSPSNVNINDYLTKNQ